MESTFLTTPFTDVTLVNHTHTGAHMVTSNFFLMRKNRSLLIGLTYLRNVGTPLDDKKSSSWQGKSAAGSLAQVGFPSSSGDTPTSSLADHLAWIRSACRLSIARLWRNTSKKSERSLRDIRYPGRIFTIWMRRAVKGEVVVDAHRRNTFVSVFFGWYIRSEVIVSSSYQSLTVYALMDHVSCLGLSLLVIVSSANDGSPTIKTSCKSLH